VAAVDALAVVAGVVGVRVVDVLVDDPTAVVALDASSSSPHATSAIATRASAADRMAPTVASHVAAPRSGDAADRRSQ